MSTSKIYQALLAAFLFAVGILLSSYDGQISSTWPSTIAFGLPLVISLATLSLRLKAHLIRKREVIFISHLSSVALSAAIIEHDFSTGLLPSSRISVSLYIALIFILFTYFITSITRQIEISKATSPPAGERDEGNPLRSFGESAQKINSSIENLQKTIRTEKKTISEDMAALRAMLLQQERALEEITREVYQKEAQVTLLEKTSRMSRSELEVFFGKLRQLRYLDYFVGFLLGIAGTTLYEHVPKLIQTILE